MSSVFKAPSPLDFATPEEVEAETLTTVYVSPEYQFYHPSAAKAWAYVEYFDPFNFTFNLYNVSALWTISLGTYILPITLTPNDELAIVMLSKYVSPALCNAILRDSNTAITIKTLDISGAASESYGVMCVAYGRLF